MKSGLKYAAIGSCLPLTVDMARADLVADSKRHNNRLRALLLMQPRSISDA